MLTIGGVAERHGEWESCPTEWYRLTRIAHRLCLVGRSNVWLCQDRRCGHGSCESVRLELIMQGLLTIGEVLVACVQITCEVMA